MTVSDNTIQVEGLVDFFKTLGKNGLNYQKSWQRNVLKNHGGALKSEQTLVVH